MNLKVTIKTTIKTNINININTNIDTKTNTGVGKKIAYKLIYTLIKVLISTFIQTLISTLIKTLISISIIRNQRNDYMHNTYTHAQPREDIDIDNRYNDSETTATAVVKAAAPSDFLTKIKSFKILS